MAIKRPVIDIIEKESIDVDLIGNSITTIYDITPGPGLLKGGGFDIESISGGTDIDFLIDVDGTIIFDEVLGKVDLITDEGPTAGMTIVETVSTFNLKLDANVNWGFLSSLKFQMRKNTAGNELVRTTGLISFHRGV